MIYRISHEAENDLKDIWLYTVANWSIEQADRYLDLIFNEFEYISNKPESGIDYSHIRKGYFKSKVKSHFIFYKTNPKKKEVEIIRILHQMMDVDEHLAL
jgi:toxin ParE1/3/4